MNTYSLDFQPQLARQATDFTKSTNLNIIDDISQKFISYPTNDSDGEFIQLKEYNKLEELLQNRQASIRVFIQLKNRLRIEIDNLKEKNQTLAKTHLEIVHFYQEKVAALKKQNQILIKTNKIAPSPKFTLKKYLNAPISASDANFSAEKPQACKEKYNITSIQQNQKVVNLHTNILSQQKSVTSRDLSQKILAKPKRSPSLTPVDMIDLKTKKQQLNLLQTSKPHPGRTVDLKQSFRQEIKHIIQKQKKRSLTKVSEYSKLRQAKCYQEVQEKLIKVKTKCEKTNKKNELSKLKSSIQSNKNTVKTKEMGIKNWSSVNL